VASSAFDLQKKVYQALKTWHEAYTEISPLAEMNLFQQEKQLGGGSNRQITNRILLKALDNLAKTHGAEADLLRRRFLDEVVVQLIANRFNIGTATVYRRQKEAIKELTRVLQAMDAASKKNRIIALENRIEATGYHKLIGVDDYLDSLQQVLLSPAPPWIVAINGMGGIGKTSLAHALAKRIIHTAAFDDFAWVSAQERALTMKGHIQPVENPALTLDDLIRKLLQQLEPETFKLFHLETADALTMLKKRLKEKSHLIVIDNLESVADMEALLPVLYSLAAPGKFLLTTRKSLYYESGVYHLHLPGLNKNQALSLVRQEAALRNRPPLLNASDEDLTPLYQAIGGNPLALRLVVGQTHIYALKTILDDLTQSKGEKTENLYTYIYRRAWNSLNEQTRLVFLAMPTVSPQGGDLDYFSAITHIPLLQVRRALEYLVTLNLVDSVGGLVERRYTVHNLTRSFLQKQVTEPSDYSLIFRRYIKRSVRFSLKEIQAAEPLPRSHKEQALYILSCALNLPEIWPEARNLALAMSSKMEQAGFVDNWLPYLKRSLLQSRTQGDRATEAELLFQTGLFFKLRGNYPQAENNFKKAAAIYQALKDLPGQARALNKMAYVARQQRRFDEASKRAQQALDLLPAKHSERAYSYLVLGVIDLDKQNWQQAANLFQQSLSVWQKEKNHRMMAWCLTNLGAALRPQERNQEAIDAYEQAIFLLEKIRDPVNLAGAQMNLGNIYLTQGEFRQALELYRPAEVTFRRAYDVYRLALVYLNMGMAYRRLEDWEQAETAYRASIKQWETLGNLAGLVNTLDGLGQLYLNRGQPKKARQIFRQAFDKLAQIKDDPAYERLLNMLERHFQGGD